MKRTSFRSLLACLIVALIVVLTTDQAFAQEVLPQASIIMSPTCGLSGDNTVFLTGAFWVDQIGDDVTIAFDGAVATTVTVDESGQFSTTFVQTALANGIYPVTASADGYSVSSTFSVPCDPTQDSGDMSGTVYLPNGQPVASGVPVGIDNFFFGAASTQTAADGSFQFAGLPQLLPTTVFVCSELGGVLHSGELNVAVPNLRADVQLQVDADGVCDRTPIDPAACPLLSVNTLAVGDTVLTVQGEAGTTLTVLDLATGLELGSGTVAARVACDSAEISLSTPLIAYQSLLVKDSLGRYLYEYVEPPNVPQIFVGTSCTDLASDTFQVFGLGWGNEVVDILWDDAVVATAQASEGTFDTGITIDNIDVGLHALTAQSTTQSSIATLIERPCVPQNADAEISGLVYREQNGAWLPAAGVDILIEANGFDIVGTTTSLVDGSYYFGFPFSTLLDVSACTTVGDTAYRASLSDVTPPAAANDLYLQPSDQACDGGLVAPTPPSDLQVESVSIEVIQDVLVVVEAIVYNDSDQPIESQFYVDVFIEPMQLTPDFTLAESVGYALLPELDAQERFTTTIVAAVPYALNVPQRVHVVADLADVVYETDELNNANSADFTPAGLIDTVAIFALAFDNPSFSDSNLAPQFAATLDGIVNASVGNPDRLAVVLADLEGDDNTQIAVVYDGQIDYISGLPDVNGVLQPDLNEYDMGDGETLGGFLRWARNSYPAATNTFSYNGHGSALMPDIDLDALSGRGAPIPLPSWIVATPDHTDTNPVSMISPHDLAVALAAATDDGADPFTVVDLVHCFGLSIEETHEVAPYTETITGSPNYAYFDAVNPGAVFAELDGSLAAAELATRIIETYDSLLPADGYPRIMAAVDADALTAVKLYWDAVSAELLSELQDDPADTRSRMTSAYQQSGKYDTSFCTADWELGAPDALSDMHDFAGALATAFSDNAPIAFSAQQTATALENAVIATVRTNGQPWFANSDTIPEWTFDGLGISFYADLVGTATPEGTLLSWHADWYQSAASAENPHPFSFIQSDSSATWADVLAAFWDGTTTIADGCMTTFPPNLDAGELVLSHIVNPTADEAQVGMPVRPSVVLETGSALRNAFVEFAVEQNGTTVFSETLSTGHIFTGTHWIVAESTWVPAQAGSYSITATIDPNDFVAEGDDADNQLIRVATVADATTALPETPLVTLPAGQQWVTSSAVPLALDGERKRGERWRVKAFEFIELDSGVAQASHLGSSLLDSDEDEVNLDAVVAPGPLQLLISAETASGSSPIPADLRFNYVPANAPIDYQETVCFPFTASVGDSLQVKLNAAPADDVNMFMWFPNGFNAPQLVGTRLGDDEFLVDYAPSSGDYLLCVRGETPDGTTYTLTVAQNQESVFVHPSSAENEADAFVPDSRFYINHANPKTPVSPSAVALQTVPESANTHGAIVGSLLLIVVVTGYCFRPKRNY